MSDLDNSLEIDIEKSTKASVDEDDLEISGEEIGLDIDFEMGSEEDTLDIKEDSVEMGSKELDESLEINMDESIEISEDEVMADISEDELVLDFEEADESSDHDEKNVLDIEELDEAISSGFDIDLTDELEALQVALSSDDEALGEESVVAVDNSSVEPEEYIELEVDEVSVDAENKSGDELESYIDPVLFDIFKNESNSHLLQIREMLDKHYQGDVALSADASLLRALHTLYGSARTAGVYEIAELCGALEKYIRIYLNRDDLSISDSGVKLVDDVCRKVSAMLETLSINNQQLLTDNDLLQKISDLSTQLKSEEIREPVTVEPDDLAANEFEIDDELVEIFLEEA